MSTVDFTHLPLVIVTFSEIYENVSQLEFIISELDKVYNISCQENKQFCLMIDTTKTIYANPSLAIKLVQWLIDKKELSKKYLICTCLLITNPIINGLLKGILNIFTPSKPFLVTDNRGEWYIYPMVMTVNAIQKRIYN